MKASAHWAVAGALALAASQASAALVNRGGGLIYDTVLNVTWLADMDHARTQYVQSGGAVGDPDGQMEWEPANAWAQGLSYGGYSDWRLPTTAVPDPSCALDLNCTGSEMGHLFHLSLGGHAGESLLDATGDSDEEIANLALFSNVLDSVYWSGTVSAISPMNHAWSFLMGTGQQLQLTQAFQLHAMAVRDGDSIGTVPEPSAAALVLLALGLMAGARHAR